MENKVDKKGRQENKFHPRRDRYAGGTLEDSMAGIEKVTRLTV